MDEELDPEEFLRRMLAISPEDAAEVREDAAKRTARDDERPGQHGPTTDSSGD